MSLCEVCSEKPFKYKCPTCSAKYCSVVCFKKHKEIHEEKKVEQSTPNVQEVKIEEPIQTKIEDESQKETNNNSDKQEEVAKDSQDSSYRYVTLEQLNKLENSEELKQLLRDSRLQKAILAINSASTDKLGVLENSVNTDPDFSDFIQNLLRVVNPTSVINEESNLESE